MTASEEAMPSHRSTQRDTRRGLVGLCDFTLGSGAGRASIQKAVKLIVVDEPVKARGPCRRGLGDRRGGRLGTLGLRLEGVGGRRHRHGCPPSQVGTGRRLGRFNDLGSTGNRSFERRPGLNWGVDGALGEWLGARTNRSRGSTCDCPGVTCRCLGPKRGPTIGALGHGSVTQPGEVDNQDGPGDGEGPPRQDRERSQWRDGNNE